MPAFQMGGLGRQIGLISAFSQGHSAQKNSPVPAPDPRSPTPAHAQGNSPDVPGSTRACKCHQALGEKTFRTLWVRLGYPWPAHHRGGSRPLRPRRERATGPKNQGRGGGEGPAEKGFTYHRSPP